MHSNAVILTYSFFGGDLIFDNSVPINGATARVSVPIFSYFHSLPFFWTNGELNSVLAVWRGKRAWDGHGC
jgi:hypothetical protein